MPCWFVTPGERTCCSSRGEIQGSPRVAVFTIVTSALPGLVLYTPLFLHFNFNVQLLRRFGPVKNCAVFASTR